MWRPERRSRKSLSPPLTPPLAPLQTRTVRSAALSTALAGIALGLLPALAPAQTASARAFVARSLSPFAMREAEVLLRTRLPCLGCHELDGEGGRVGPSLSNMKGRPADSVYAMISDPQRTAPGTRMPRVRMSASTLELIASYLIERAPNPASARQTEQDRGPRHPLASNADAAALYEHYCSPCHGASGSGNGRNARFLPIPPTAHTKAAYMSTRSDDQLFDMISAGGYVMNRSPRMPPFGGTLSTDQIWSLVGYLRTLCRCEGPAWSRGAQ